MQQENVTFNYTAEQIVQHYIALRDTAKKITERYARELEPYKVAMAALENEASRMMRHFKTNLSTEFGTAFWTTRESYKVENPELFRNWVIDKEEWRMTTNHVSKDGIRAWREEQQQPADWPANVEYVPPVPPGIAYECEMVVQFRKG